MKKYFIIFILFFTSFLKTSEKFQEKTKRSAFAYNLFHEACFQSKAESILYWSTFSFQGYKVKPWLKEKPQSWNDFTAAISFDYKIRTIGHMRFTALHELGHTLYRGTPQQAFKKNREEKLIAKEQGFIWGLAGCVGTLLATHYIQNKETKTSLEGQCLRIATASIAGLMTYCVTENYYLSCFSWKEERFADEHALKNLNCSKCCFETAETYNDGISPLLSQAIRTLIGDGHEAGKARSQRFFKQGDQDQKQNKLCKWHKYPWLQKAAEHRIKLEAKKVEKQFQLYKQQKEQQQQS